MPLLRASFVIGLGVAIACGDADERPAVEAAQRQAAARPTSQVDVCGLLTEGEAEAITGKALNPPQRQANGDCWYLKEGGTNVGHAELMLSILPMRIRSGGDFDRLISEDVRRMNRSLEKSGVKGDFAAERVDGPGQAAYYVDPSLFVLVDGRVLGIVAPKDQAVAVAEKAVPRLDR